MSENGSLLHALLVPKGEFTTHVHVLYGDISQPRFDLGPYYTGDAIHHLLNVWLQAVQQEELLDEDTANRPPTERPPSLPI